MHIQFLYYEDCPSHEKALSRLQQVMAEEKVEADVEIIEVETDDQAERWHFIGSPTILIDGHDIDPPAVDATTALTCRVYVLPNGRYSPLPAAETIRAAIRNATAGG